MDLITKDNLKLIASGDFKTLIQLDNHGILLGPEESLENYANRLGKLKENFSEFDRELEKDGEIDLIGVQFKNSDKIPQEIFQSAEQITRKLYDFDIDWVPGFFTNSKMGLLFAGCAMYSYTDFFAIFIIRKAFKLKERWIIYSRTELMAHELCHIAHIGFHTKNYEEIFAYQTSESLFRKMLGGMLRSTTDTYIMLSTVIVLLLSQFANVLLRPPSEWQNFPMPLIYFIAFLTIAFIFLRYVFYWNRFRRASKNLAKIIESKVVMPVLFRCSESEIKEIARLKKQTDLQQWIDAQQHKGIRWKIILEKYFSIV